MADEVIAGRTADRWGELLYRAASHPPFNPWAYTSQDVREGWTRLGVIAARAAAAYYEDTAHKKTAPPPGEGGDGAVEAI
jgi:hypothetical protein